MAAYFDTSVLIPLFFNETGTAAGRLCETTPAPGLRTPDALHLAMALRLGLPMVAFDKALISACRLHGAPYRAND